MYISFHDGFSFQVHPFHTMLRKVGAVKRIQDVAVSASDVQPFLPQYKQALEQLKLQLNSK